MRKTFFAGAVLAVASTKPIQAATCKMDQFNFVFGSDVSAHQVVKSGTVCSSHFNVGGGGISSLKITRQAQHGVVGMSASYYWAYKANSGYFGKDSYVIEISGESMTNRGATSSGSTSITVDVDVVP